MMSELAKINGRSGQRGAVLHQSQVSRKILVDELGVDLPTETTSLLQKKLYQHLRASLLYV